MAAEAHRVPVTVLGGYLGAGKTTVLIAALTAAHGQRLAVIVNDFGDLHIDAALIADRAATRIDLANGCACCQVGDNLAEAFFQLAEQVPPWDRIVVEASGVADPARVAGWASLPGLRLDGIVVAADATAITTQVDDHYVGDLVRHQLATADIVVVTKADLVDAETLSRVTRTIRINAPTAPIVPSPDAPPVEALFDLDHRTTPPPGADHHERFETTTWYPPGPLDHHRLVDTIGSIPGLVRAKGFVPTGDGRVLVQAVGSRVQLTLLKGEFVGGERVGLVVIGLRGMFDPAGCHARLDAVARPTD